MVSYEMTKRVRGAQLGEAKALVTAALKAEGFGVLTEIDVQKTLKSKLDVDTRPYVILGACNPALAYRALQIEPAIGLLLPCNVVLRQEDHATVVSFARAEAMFAVVGNAALEPVVREADERLRRALDRVPEDAARAAHVVVRSRTDAVDPQADTEQSRAHR